MYGIGKSFFFFKKLVLLVVGVFKFMESNVPTQQLFFKQSLFCRKINGLIDSNNGLALYFFVGNINTVHRLLGVIAGGSFGDYSKTGVIIVPRISGSL